MKQNFLRKGSQSDSRRPKYVSNLCSKKKRKKNSKGSLFQIPIMIVRMNQKKNRKTM